MRPAEEPDLGIRVSASVERAAIERWENEGGRPLAPEVRTIARGERPERDR